MLKLMGISGKMSEPEASDHDTDIELDSDSDSDYDYEDTKNFNTYYEGKRINKKQRRGYLSIEGFKFVKLWAYNRDITQKKVDKIYHIMLDDYESNYEDDPDEYYCPITSSDINICKLGSEYYVIDGQHRFHALHKLFKKIDTVFYIPVLITDVESDKEIRKRFVTINKHTAVDGEKLKQAKTETLCNKIEEHFSKCFKRKDGIWGVNRPFLNKREFVKAVRDNNLTTLSAETMLKKLILYNYNILKGTKPVGVSKPTFEKAQKANFGLGLDKKFLFLKEF